MRGKNTHTTPKMFARAANETISQEQITWRVNAPEVNGTTKHDLSRANDVNSTCVTAATHKWRFRDNPWVMTRGNDVLNRGERHSKFWHSGNYGAVSTRLTLHGLHIQKLFLIPWRELGSNAWIVDSLKLPGTVEAICNKISRCFIEHIFPVP